MTVPDRSVGDGRQVVDLYIRVEVLKPGVDISRLNAS